MTGEIPTHVAKAPESFKGNLVEWISQLSSYGKLHDAIDTSLVGKGVDNELFQFLKVACNCVLPSSKERPTMFEVYQLLRAIRERYNFKCPSISVCRMIRFTSSDCFMQHKLDNL